MNRQVPHGDTRHFSTLVARPFPSSVEGNPQSKFCSEEKEILVDQVFLDDMRVPSDGTIGRDERHPCLAITRGFVRVRLHVAKRVHVESRVDRALVEMSGLDR